MDETTTPTRALPLRTKHGNIYERMARSQYLRAEHRSEGEPPRRIHIVRFFYANGLVADYNGEKWSVVVAEKDA